MSPRRSKAIVRPSGETSTDIQVPSDVSKVTSRDGPCLAETSQRVAPWAFSVRGQKARSARSRVVCIDDRMFGAPERLALELVDLALAVIDVVVIALHHGLHLLHGGF